MMKTLLELGMSQTFFGHTYTWTRPQNVNLKYAKEKLVSKQHAIVSSLKSYQIFSPLSHNLLPSIPSKGQSISHKSVEAPMRKIPYAVHHNPQLSANIFKQMYFEISVVLLFFKHFHTLHIFWHLVFFLLCIPEPFHFYQIHTLTI